MQAWARRPPPPTLAPAFAIYDRRYSALIRYYDQNNNIRPVGVRPVFYGMLMFNKALGSSAQMLKASLSGSTDGIKVAGGRAWGAGGGGLVDPHRSTPQLGLKRCSPLNSFVAVTDCHTKHRADLCQPGTLAFNRAPPQASSA